MVRSPRPRRRWPTGPARCAWSWKRPAISPPRSRPAGSTIARLGTNAATSPDSSRWCWRPRSPCHPRNARNWTAVIEHLQHEIAAGRAPDDASLRGRPPLQGLRGARDLHRGAREEGAQGSQDRSRCSGRSRFTSTIAGRRSTLIAGARRGDERRGAGPHGEGNAGDDPPQGRVHGRSPRHHVGRWRSCWFATGVRRAGAASPSDGLSSSVPTRACCKVVTRAPARPGYTRGTGPACSVFRGSERRTGRPCSSPRRRCSGSGNGPRAPIRSGSSRRAPCAATSATTRRPAAASSTATGATPSVMSSPRSAATARFSTAR